MKVSPRLFFFFLTLFLNPNEQRGIIPPPQPAFRCREYRIRSGDMAWDPGAAPCGQRGDIRVGVLQGRCGAWVGGGWSRALWSVFLLNRNPGSCSREMPAPQTHRLTATLCLCGFRPWAIDSSNYTHQDTHQHAGVIFRYTTQYSLCNSQGRSSPKCLSEIWIARLPNY